jgi:hypothetical protein
MPAAKRDIYLEQGATARFALQWFQPTSPPRPYDITGAQVWMQLRTSAGEVLVDVRDGAGIELLGPLGLIRITLTAEQTWALTTRRVRYDLVLQLPGGDVIRLMEGRGQVSKATTDYREQTLIPDVTVPVDDSVLEAVVAGEAVPVAGPVPVWEVVL